MGTRQALFVLNEPTAPRLAPQLANEIGLNESILLLQIEFWIRISGKEIDGKQWVYESISDIQEAFPFWGRSTINRIVHSLEKKKLIHTDNHNKYKYDRTRWFALNPEGCSNLSSIVLTDVLCHNGTRETQDGTRETQNGTTIPDLSADLSTEEDAAVPPADDLPKKPIKEFTDYLSMCAEVQKRNNGVPDWAIDGPEGVSPYYEVLLAFCAMTKRDALQIKTRQGRKWLKKYAEIANTCGASPAHLLEAHKFLPDEEWGKWYLEHHQWGSPDVPTYSSRLGQAAQQIANGTIIAKNQWSKAMI